MAEPTVICPNCKTEIKLNESLAGPLLEATRRDFEKRMKQKDTDLAAKLKEEAAKIAAEEARKARLALSNELEQKTRTVADLEKNLTENNTKLAEAQKAQAVHDRLPDSIDPRVAVRGSLSNDGFDGPGGWNQRRDAPDYTAVVRQWRLQNPRYKHAQSKVIKGAYRCARA